MSQLIPVTADAPHFDLQVQLEGATFTLELRWNDRMGLWVLSVYDASGEVVSAGRPVVLGADLLGRSASSRRPPGFLTAIDSAGGGVEAGRSDLGTRVQLIYVASTEA